MNKNHSLPASVFAMLCLITVCGILVLTHQGNTRFEFVQWEDSIGGKTRATVERKRGWLLWKESRRGIVFGSGSYWHWEDTMQEVRSPHGIPLVQRLLYLQKYKEDRAGAKAGPKQ